MKTQLNFNIINVTEYLHMVCSEFRAQNWALLGTDPPPLPLPGLSTDSKQETCKEKQIYS